MMRRLVSVAALSITSAFAPQPIIKSTHRSINRCQAATASSELEPPSVLCIGETLWDSLPSGLYLGGAPSNVAVHLASLLPDCDTVAVASCLGKDQLGNEARRRMELKGVRTDYIQFHDDWDTGMLLYLYLLGFGLRFRMIYHLDYIFDNSGMAIAMIDNNGDATYEFNTPAAWDGLGMNEQLSTLINSEEGKTHSTIYIMGTIAGRLQSEKGATSSSTLSAVRNNAPNGSVVLDVNLRSPWYDSDKVITLARGDSSSRKLALLKLNDEELAILEDWCGLTSDTNELKESMLRDRMKKLAGSLNTQRICVTRGANGAALWCESTDNNDIFHENTGYSLDTSGDSDTVGAGDAFLAGLVNSLFILNELPGQALERACALGGYVAGCRGATPDHNDAPLELRQIFQHEVKRKQLAQ